MILYPAIDLKDGQCVRLAQGDMKRATVFNDDPAAQARAFADAGASWIHVVDLNGAFAGKPVNADAVEAIVAAVDQPVQLGGGIRDMAMVSHWLSSGVERIVLGTAAVKNPDLVRESCAAFPGRIAVGIDARGGRVAVEGWAETSDITASDLAKRFEDVGVAAIIHTDIDRDGVLGGPNIDASAALADAVGIPVIVSGGVATIDDLSEIKSRAQTSPGITGVISGRALYDGQINLSEAIALLAK
ncbi:MAG: 1-(5-phosphoribosyl)-5-[(5-phosphoribosylamino)methylideneamino]imidazole-4-carboxamide isomerase [Rhodospirillaceae bacterium]|nr:1-(5-phosphoribosyl)-5-[(5-phosphoribosylamino)methylideneamino]imidazole-4-carboxamide isomerase [Rhodospirillaceae bacterium]MBT5240917.1 1-(5-phosphoribosyl)-5-[(5-phosphoribosylamino)methylideneamino]imidazole-4-carboxamide isomerase [Rhodospirillaceae bacterium]MBT5564982.1 1-(5-phosphoribosyl)-5-[(5-phosphoribosylamino)methylideneamino]imidazole-4-carboxamide isomerase [Rhodospirillaceae bacterium]MBT6090254.1 1-(5-phosphoribosyl)-5-[(5-phosphoribosylamino)methylideneamino]imidazole-4-c